MQILETFNTRTIPNGPGIETSIKFRMLHLPSVYPWTTGYYSMVLTSPSTQSKQ